MVIYNHLSQLHIFKATAKMNLDGGEKFHIEFQITDGHRFVCNAVVKPLLRNHRTGEWFQYVIIGVAKDMKLSESLSKRLKDYIKETATEILYVMTGEW